MTRLRLLVRVTVRCSSGCRGLGLPAGPGAFMVPALQGLCGVSGPHQLLQWSPWKTRRGRLGAIMNDSVSLRVSAAGPDTFKLTGSP